jgi:hypothetical protein
MPKKPKKDKKPKKRHKLKKNKKTGEEMLLSDVCGYDESSILDKHWKKLPSGKVKKGF